MAGGVVMKQEIFQGIFGGLAMILVVVVIGSLIGTALSHGHEEGHGDAPAVEAGAAEGGDAAKPEGDAKPADGAGGAAK